MIRERPSAAALQEEKREEIYIYHKARYLAIIPLHTSPTNININKQEQQTTTPTHPTQPNHQKCNSPSSPCSSQQQQQQQQSPPSASATTKATTTPPEASHPSPAATAPTASSRPTASKLKVKFLDFLILEGVLKLLDGGVRRYVILFTFLLHLIVFWRRLVWGDWDVFCADLIR